MVGDPNFLSRTTLRPKDAIDYFKSYNPCTDVLRLTFGAESNFRGVALLYVLPDSGPDLEDRVKRGGDNALKNGCDSEYGGNGSKGRPAHREVERRDVCEVD
jgi:hypothetical protein